MLNEDFETDNDYSKSKVQLLKTYSVVATCPSVSTIVSLSDGICKINKYSNETNDTKHFKELNYKQPIANKTTNPFIYKKSVSLLNTTHNKGFCIQKKMTFDPSAKPFLSMNNNHNNSSDEFEVFSQHEECISALLIAIRSNRNSCKECIDLWALEVNNNVTLMLEKYLRKSKVKVSLNYLKYLKLISIMLSYVFGNYFNNNDTKRKLTKLIVIHHKILIILLQLLIGKNTPLPHHLVHEITNLIAKSDLNTNKTITSNLRNNCQFDYKDEYYSSSITNYINSIHSLHNYFFFHQLNEYRSMRENPIDCIYQVMQSQDESTFSIDDIDAIFKTKIIPIKNYNYNEFRAPIEMSLNKSMDKIDCNNQNLYLNKESLKEYTLVLDLQNTLVNYIKESNNTNVVKFRPGLHKFLSSCCLYYELVVFTSLPQEV